MQQVIKTGLLVSISVALALTLTASFNGCSGSNNKEKQVVVFIIDSLSGLMPEHQRTFSFLKDLTHGEVVHSIIEQYGSPDQLFFSSVDSIRGTIDRDAYIGSLTNIDEYVTHHSQDKVVVNISFGSFSRDAQEERLINTLLDKGVIIVAAAGNEGMEKVCYPAAYERVIAVGASDRNKIAPYSNYGKEIDIIASGTFRSYQRLTLPTDTGYETLTREIVLKGTSLATPKVAGTIARMLHFARGREIEPETILKQTAKPVEDPLYPKGTLGSGLLSRDDALSAVEPTYVIYSFIDWLGRLFWAWSTCLASLITFLTAYVSVLYSRHKRLKRAAINIGLVPGFLAGMFVFSDLVFNFGFIDYSNLSEFIQRHTYSILGCMILAVGVFGVTAVIGITIGKSIAYLYTLHKIDYSKKAEDISRLQYEMELCYTISGIQKGVLRGITECGRKAISYLTKWLIEDRMPDLDREMIEILREFNRKYSLSEHLIQVASDKSKSQRLIEVLGIIADKEDRKALSFLHSLEDDEDVGYQAKRAIGKIVSDKA